MVCRLDQIGNVLRAPAFQPVWYLANAENQVLDTFALEMARVLIGRARPTFSHNQNVGDFLVVVNTDRIVYPDKSWLGNFYKTRTGKPRGEKYRSAGYFHTRDRAFILWMEIKFQLRKSQWRNEMLKKMFLFPEDKHPFLDRSLIKLDITKFDGINNDHRLSDLTPEILANYPKLQLAPCLDTSKHLIENIKKKI